MPNESRKRSYTSEEVTNILLQEDDIAALQRLIDDIENSQMQVVPDLQEEEDITSFEHLFQDIQEVDVIPPVDFVIKDSEKREIEYTPFFFYKQWPK